MTSGWPLVALNDIFEIARGGSPRPIDKFITDDPDGVNWVLISDATDGGKYINSTKKRIRPDGVSRSREVKPGDFLLTNSMSFGRPYIMNTHGCVHDGWLILSPRSKEVSGDFFYHLLGSTFMYSEFKRRAAGATVKNLNIEIVRDVRVPVPPIHEQRRIAAILDKGSALHTKRRQALAVLSSLRMTLFRDLFGDLLHDPHQWPTATLGEILEFLTSGSRGWATYYRDSGDIFLRIQNVGRDELLLDDVTYVNAPNNAEARRTKVTAGDVLLSITADLGRTAVVPESLGAAYINQHLAILRFKQSVIPQYVSSYLASPAGQYSLLRRNRQGVKAGLNFDDIRSIVLPIPPRYLQERFASAVAHFLSTKQMYVRACQSAEALFHSLQDRAFRGEL